jgi:hypothetical protein
MEIENLKQRIEYLTKISDTTNMLKNTEKLSNDWSEINNYLNECYKLNDDFDKMISKKYKEQIDWVLEKFTKGLEGVIVSESFVKHRDNLFTISIEFDRYFRELLDEISNDLNIHHLKKYLENLSFMVKTVQIEVDIKNHIISEDSKWRVERLVSMYNDIIIPNKEDDLSKWEKIYAEKSKSILRFLPSRKKFIKEIGNEILKNKERITVLNYIIDNIHPLLEEYHREVLMVVNKIKDTMYESTNIEFFIQS